MNECLARTESTPDAEGQVETDMGWFMNKDGNESADEGQFVEPERDSQEDLRKEEARKLAHEMLARDRQAVELNVKVVPIL